MPIEVKVQDQTQDSQNLGNQDSIIRGEEDTEQVTFTWVKVFRIIPVFRFLRLTFHRKSGAKSWIRLIIIASLVYVIISMISEFRILRLACHSYFHRKSAPKSWIRLRYLRTFDLLNLHLFVFGRNTASFKSSAFLKIWTFTNAFSLLVFYANGFFLMFWYIEPGMAHYVYEGDTGEASR